MEKLKVGGDQVARFAGSMSRMQSGFPGWQLCEEVASRQIHGLQILTAVGVQRPYLMTTRRVARRITVAGKEDDADSLMVTRSIGDWSFKSNLQLSQAVSAVPDIVNFDISKGCDFLLILVSDGVDKNSIDN
ncbi:hypothetical protein SELMODRAFT_403288 [Selaginella moellendorffii]|uniref:PPM-type phosphatase domain-containing protein n=1 Tax=Selaginella moellendorffii TaxID=88036 RepID=D8QTP1_SELML|nr:hypothetical protein SELMODRAFT_403288 [Selaginella moellendorffii]